MGCYNNNISVGSSSGFGNISSGGSGGTTKSVAPHLIIAISE